MTDSELGQRKIVQSSYIDEQNKDMIDPTKLRKGDLVVTLVDRPELRKGSQVIFQDYSLGWVIYDEIVPKGSKLRYAGVFRPKDLDYDSMFPPCADD